MTGLRQRLIEGQAELPRFGRVEETGRRFPPYTVLDAAGDEIAPVSAYLKDLALSDISPLTCRSYSYDLQRWFRLLNALGAGWESATGSEADVLVGWMRSARNPQRCRTQPGATPPGTVNMRTGKPALAAGYAPRTINHTLTVIHGFYAFHAHYGRGPVANPIPSSRERRVALAHRSPIDAKAMFRRARLRQRVPEAEPRAIPDGLWEELFAEMTSDRDRALLLFYVSSGARAAELLGVTLGDVDWAGMRVYVISKGTRRRQAVPASPEAFRYLALYLEQDGLPETGQPLWRTQRGEPRALTYWAMRRILQRANERLSTNWTLHDLRHTAATRMANDPKMTLSEVQTILRHADIDTTGRYTRVRLDDVIDKLQEHYERPRPQRAYAPGYAAEDIKAVFGG